MDCHTDLATDIATRLSGAVVIWGWGGYIDEFAQFYMFYSYLDYSFNILSLNE